MRAVFQKKSRCAAVLLVAALSACSTRSAPPAPVIVPQPAPQPVDTAPSIVRYRLPLVVNAGYSVRIRTQLERDSAGRREQDVVESSARVELAITRNSRGWLRGAGRVDSFVVQGAGATARTSTPIAASTTTIAAPTFTSVAFDAVLDSTQIRAVVRPPLPNECDRPEAAAADVARDLLVRIPETVSAGETWRDSVATLVCRGGVPMTVRTTIETVVSGVTDGGQTLQLRRTLTTRIEGNSRTPWRQVDIAGDGTGTQTVQVDVARGVMTALDGESTLTVRVTNGSLRDAARVQQVVQKSALTVRVLLPR